MHWIKCSVLITTLCVVYCHDSVTESDLTNKALKNFTTETSTDTDNNIKKLEKPSVFESVFTVKITPDYVSPNLTDDVQNVPKITENSKEANISTFNSEIQLNFNSERKREATNVTFNDIYPLLFFPILPLLFPPKEKENQSVENKFLSPQNEKVDADGNSNEVKPLIFFDFAFIRRIPMNNTPIAGNSSDFFNTKKLRIKKAEDSKKNSPKNRRRRNTSITMEAPQFFDDSPLFPDSELDEFLPKSDLFFPDLPFHHHKPLKKLVRRKRDQKKPDLKSDLKFFFDAFDEAFMQTKRDLERTDPILNFLRGDQPSVDDDRKENIFEQIPSIHEKPRMKWRIQRNIKRLKNDHQDGLRRAQNGPMIIVDKVVKIGEFHVPDDALDKDKLKKKRENELKKKLFRDEIASFEKDETFPKNVFDLKQEEKRKKRNHLTKATELNDEKIKFKEIRIIPEITAPDQSLASNVTSETTKKETSTQPQLNLTSNDSKYGNLMKVIDSLRSKIKLGLTNEGAEKQKGETYFKKLNARKASYENLKKNITELLSQFLDLSKNVEDVKFMEKPGRNEHDEAGIFDWTEKETLQTANELGKNPRDKRQKKDADFVDEYADLTKKEKQIADLNYLFLTVTLPTVFVFAVVFLTCFFSLQVKGKICSRLFRPRQVFIVEDEKLMQFKKPTPQMTQKL